MVHFSPDCDFLNLLVCENTGSASTRCRGVLVTWHSCITSNPDNNGIISGPVMCQESCQSSGVSFGHDEPRPYIFNFIAVSGSGLPAILNRDTCTKAGVCINYKSRSPQALIGMCHFIKPSKALGSASNRGIINVALDRENPLSDSSK